MCCALICPCTSKYCRGLFLLGVQFTLKNQKFYSLSWWHCTRNNLTPESCPRNPKLLPGQAVTTLARLCESNPSQLCHISSCFELLLMPLGGSGGMPPRKLLAFSCSEIGFWCNLIGGKLVSSLSMIYNFPKSKRHGLQLQARLTSFSTNLL